ncbi:M13 family metallopeptidase [Alkalicaulis satelles]|uniref:M13 family metallopeptidase n=1 Tax=Alkalicaulis satelles TaxID=2609175 RepID=A0A5M6ZP65_9PROT|nr:M13 family metallopeptidase [Alkalicaulis satelles]
MKWLMAGAAGLALGASSAAFADAPRFGDFGFDETGMDRSVHPGDDFYAFANGAWDERTEIPSDRARYGVFDMLSLEVEQQVRSIILDAAEHGGPEGSNEQMIADLFASWMDAEAIEEAGLAPALPYLNAIAAISSHEDAAALMAQRPYHAPYSVFISADPEDPSRYIMRSGQSGLGLPTRDYYLLDTGRFPDYREAYLAYIGQIFELAGLPGGPDMAQAILALETALAEAHWTREDSRDVSLTNNRMSTAEFFELAPGLHLDRALEARGLPADGEIIVAQPSAITGAGEVIASTDVETLKAWLSFHFLSDRASWLPAAFDQANFDFFSRTLSGVEEQRERELRGVQLVNGALGHLVGQVYVERYYPPEASRQMDELITNLTEGFRGRLERLDWMDDETREEALTKLSAFEPRIGYPEVWNEFDGLELRAGDYFGNRMRMSDFAWDEQLRRFPDPVDRRRWGWPPQIVNASYSPLMNQITFPAGILQAPFFDMHADAAMNYGAIGAVIGHEIGHGFDDNGRRFDAEGRIRDWWTAETNERFVERSDRLVEQYNEFCPFEDACVNGRVALGENIGDLGGMQMAYEAYRNYAAANYPDGEPPVINGFTGDQRFFLAWAQVWRTLFREDALRAQLARGPHSPGMYRVNGVVRNLDAWYDAFGITEEHELYIPSDQRVRIW